MLDVQKNDSVRKKSKNGYWGGKKKRSPMRAGLTAVDGEATLLPEGENGPPCGSRVPGF